MLRLRRRCLLLFAAAGLVVVQSSEAVAQPVPLSGVMAIAAGDNHTCALLSNKRVACWGDNSYGQYGDGMPGNTNFPVYTSALAGTPTAIAAGGNDTCALLSSGAVQCWGASYPGPQVIANVSNATAIGVGSTTCGTLTNGSITCWNNADGVHASGTVVSGLGFATAVACGTGFGFECSLRSDGTSQCIGDNRYGELGNGTTTSPTSPTFVSDLSGATAISAGLFAACAVLSGGTVQCWGDNELAELGDGTVGTGANLISTTPVAVVNLTGATAIASSSVGACALLSTHQVMCWGENDAGEVGNGTVNSTSPVPTPVLVSNISTATQISAGGKHTCALLSNGEVECWGDLGGPAAGTVVVPTPQLVMGGPQARGPGGVVPALGAPQVAILALLLGAGGALAIGWRRRGARTQAS